LKRRILLFVSILICFILQTTVFAQGSIVSSTPNLLLIMTVSIAFIYGKKTGLLTGFVCGLFFDIYYGELIGLYALIFMYIGFGAGYFSKVYNDEDLRVPLIITAAADVIYSFAVYVVGFFVRGRLNFGSYLIHVILPELAATLIFCIILYRIVFLISRAIKKQDMKGRRRTWLKG
jgi:rod shape-determining protein MreD